jgi:hypothetical protein
MVFTHAHVITGVNVRAALAYQYGPGINHLPGKSLDTKPLALAVPAVTALGSSLFMRHLLSPLSSYAVFFSPV